MATTTFKLGDMTVHRIIEMESGFTPALEFLPTMTPQMLDESRSWLKKHFVIDNPEVMEDFALAGRKIELFLGHLFGCGFPARRRR